MDVKISDIFLGCSKNQCDGILKAFDIDTQENIGFLEYSESTFDIKEPVIKMIEVADNYKLLGIGK